MYTSQMQQMAINTDTEAAILPVAHNTNTTTTTTTNIMVTVYGGGLHNNGIFLLSQCVHWSFMHNTEAMPDKIHGSSPVDLLP